MGLCLLWSLLCVVGGMGRGDQLVLQTDSGQHIVINYTLIRLLLSLFYMMFFGARLIGNWNRRHQDSRSLKILRLNPDRVIGKGSNGTLVYEGYLQSKKIAIKRTISDELDLSEQEIKILLKLDNRNIIKYYCFEKLQQYTFIGIEKCLCSLDWYIDYENKVVPQDSLFREFSGLFTGRNFKQLKKQKKMIKQIVEGINYLHNKNIVHRDLKCQNILISYDFDIKLADFSISKELEDRNVYQTGNLGTFGWRAPEVIEDKEYKSTASDIFSLGCIMYYYFTLGTHPFGAPSEREYNILRYEYDIGLAENDALFQDLLRMTLERDPALRIRSGQILGHPFFWYNEDRLNFLCEFSEYLEYYEKKDPSNFDQFDKEARDNQVIPLPWNAKLPAILVKDALRINGNIDFESPKVLIRFIRNRKSHFHELGNYSKSRLGESIEKIYGFFDKKYPRLFKFCYDFALRKDFQLIFMKKLQR